MAIMWLVIFIMASVQAERVKERPVVYCGRTLGEARLLYCFGSDDNPQKKSVYNLVGPWYPANHIIEDRWPIMSYEYALSLKKRGKRVPGLADECCLKACYISELTNYC